MYGSDRKISVEGRCGTFGGVVGDPGRPFAADPNDSDMATFRVDPASIERS